MHMARTKSGIPGIDEIIGGGFPEGTCCLVTGTAGSGRTIFGVQFLYNGITEFAENGVYVSLENRPKDLRYEMLNFGWDLKKMEDQNKLAIVDIGFARDHNKSPEKYTLTMGSRLNVSALSVHIFEVCKEVKAKRVVIDSLQSLQMRLKDITEMRRATSLLCDLLLEMGRTSLMITETAVPQPLSHYGFKEHITRGVIVMQSIPQNGEFKRTIQVLKMLGTRHSTRTYPMEITGQGIVVTSLL